MILIGLYIFFSKKKQNSSNKFKSLKAEAGCDSCECQQ